MVLVHNHLEKLAMQLTRPSLRALPAPQRLSAIAFVREGRLVFAVCLAAYLATAVALVFRGSVVLGDALARVENVDRVLFSRDPHLAALGFNYPPFPQLLYLPFVPLKYLWPPLVQSGFVGNVFSAFFMAGAAVQLLKLFEEAGLVRPTRLVLVATFAVQPMILYSAGNGMTEACALFFLLVAVRHFNVWLRSADLKAQVITGCALGCAFLTRYELAFAGAGVVALAAIVTLRREGGQQRLSAAVSDAVIFGAPLFLCTIGWLTANWAITGSPFAEASNAYGTAQLLHSSGFPPSGLALTGLVAITAMEPLLPLLLLVSAILVATHRDVRIASVIVTFGPVLLFMYWAFTTKHVLPSLRYMVVAVPLATLLCGLLLAPPEQAQARVGTIARTATILWLPTSGRFGGRLRRRRPARALASLLLPGFITFGLLAAIPTTTAAMWTEGRDNGLLSVFQLRDAFNRDGTAALTWNPAVVPLQADRAVAGYLDALDVPRGSVLVDDFAGFAIFADSNRPEQFVIASDRDFQAALADPLGAGIEYILVPRPTDIFALEAVNRTYPDFYQSGGGIAHLVKEFSNVNGPPWRLYRINGS